MKALPLLLVLLLALACRPQKVVTKRPEIPLDAIAQQTYTYAEVDRRRPLAVWEAELGLPNYASSLLERNSRQDLLLDLYGPRDAVRRPLVVLVHGGAFLPGVGGRADTAMRVIAGALAQRGYRVASIDYRGMDLLAPSFLKGAYTATQDNRAALRYLVNHADSYHLDRDNIHLLGISAGAITALNTAFLQDGEPIGGRAAKFERMYGCLDCVGEEALQPYRIRSVTSFAGALFDPAVVSDNPDIATLLVCGGRDEVIPVDHGLPYPSYTRQFNELIELAQSYAVNYPLLLQELEEGKMLPVCGSRRVQSALQKAGNDCELVELPDATHDLLFSTTDVLTAQGKELIARTAAFCYEHS